MYKILILLVLLVLAFCKQEDSLRPSCSDDLICTEEFRSVTIEITDSNGIPVELDYHYTFNKTNGQIYQFENQPATGVYTVLSDAQLKDILQTGSVIVFSGTINGEKINEQFLIGHDCCHIEKVAGENSIVLSAEE